jgi:hypothetical protein
MTDSEEMVRRDDFEKIVAQKEFFEEMLAKAQKEIEDLKAQLAKSKPTI